MQVSKWRTWLFDGNIGRQHKHKQQLIRIVLEVLLIDHRHLPREHPTSLRLQYRPYSFFQGIRKEIRENCEASTVEINNNSSKSPLLHHSNPYVRLKCYHKPQGKHNQKEINKRIMKKSQSRRSSSFMVGSRCCRPTMLTCAGPKTPMMSGAWAFWVGQQRKAEVHLAACLTLSNSPNTVLFSRVIGIRAVHSNIWY